MNTFPLITVVLPTRNRVQYLSNAIETVLQQTWPALELIVVDDGSTDDTPRLVDEFVKADARVRYVRNDRPRGACNARNVGVREGVGEFIAFIDDDCTWDPRKLETQISHFADSDIGLVYCHQAVEGYHGELILQTDYVAGSDPREILPDRSIIGTHSMVVRRDVFEAVGGFDEGLPRLQDWDLCLRLARVTRFICVPQILARSKLLPGGISSRPAALACAARIVRQKIRHEYGLSTRRAARFCYAIGKFLAADGLRWPAFRLFCEAVRFNPLYLPAWLGMGLSPFGRYPFRLARSARWAFRRRSVR